MTVCDMTIEGGGRAGMIAPDDTTYEWVIGRPARAGRRATPAEWREFYTDEGAEFDKVVDVDASALAPQVTWGTNAGMVVAVTARGGSGRLRRETEPSARSSTWISSPAPRSRRSASTACSSARARTRASAICAPRRA